MATGAVTMLLSRNDQLLYEVKKGIKAEGEKQVSKVMEKLPSPQQLQAQFNESPIFSQEEFNKVEKEYFKTKEFLIKSKKQLENSKTSLLKLKDKTQKAENTIEKIKGILKSLDLILKSLNAAVIAAKIVVSVVGSIPSTAASPNPAGPIIKANDIAKLAGGKIKSFKALVTSITSIFPYYLNLIKENFSILDKALEALNKLMTQIDQLIQLLEQLYLQLLKNMSLQNPANTDNETGGVNPLDSASTPEDLYAQVPDLSEIFNFPHQPKADPPPGNIKDKEYIEYKEEEDGVKRAYRRYKK